jgi:transglutaminase-like putative cysteine protease
MVLLAVPSVFASQEASDIFASEQVTIDLSVSSDLTITPKEGKQINMEYVQANVYFYPKQDTAQQVWILSTEPESANQDDSLKFYWESPSSRTLSYKINSKVQVRNFFPRVTKKILFPLRSIPAEVQRYTAPTARIDSSTPEIMNLANQLAQGNDDLFDVVSELAIWTKNNIAYNISTMTADASQKASWVLANRQGVCDELTSLFIAMCRALGIPARFVTGVSYTASPLFDTNWGNHGWAEVYFPDAGWVPFDPTFGEFGWIDPGHIKMITGLDPEMPGVRFEWRGNGNVQYSEQKVEAKIASVAKRMPPIIDISVKPVYNEVGFGSWNLAQVTVENLQPFYITTELRLAQVDELQPAEPLARQVILKPREKKTIFWRVETAPNLDKRFIYTMPIGVYTVMNYSVISHFFAKPEAVQHTKADITRVMNQLSEEDEQVVSQNLDMACIKDSDEIYPGGQAGVNCTLTNMGTTPLRGVSACISDKQCVGLDIGIGQARHVSFTQGFTAAGSATVFVQAKGQELTKSVPLGFMMYDLPEVNITGIVAPASVEYGKKFKLLFVLKPESYSPPQEVRLKVTTQSGTRNFEMPELPGEQLFDIDIDSGELGLGATDIRIEANYKDRRGRQYKSSAAAQISLTDVPFFPSIWLWVRGLFE